MTRLYRFDDAEIDLQSFRLSKAEKVVPVEPKALNLLIFLVRNRGRLVERQELIDAVWGDAFVTDHVLNRAIGQLRKGLADDAKDPRYIETVPTLGYRFISQVEEIAGEVSAPGPSVSSKSSEQQATGEIAAKRWRSWQRAAVVSGLALLLALSAGALWIKSRERSVSGITPIRSLAVLPLENLSGDPSQEYLADGMTDEVITGLGQISALRVVSRTTAMQYKNAHKSLPQIARELSVDAVVEGSVVRSGDRVRIAAQLFDAPADKQLWARSFDGDLGDVLGLQNQVASAVAEQIRIELTPNERTQLADARQVNPRAYDTFLKGNSLDQNTPESWRKALSYFQEATQLDPNFARAYVGIARSYNYLNGWAAVPVGEATAAADVADAKALELDPQLGEAYAERAWTLMFFHWDFPGTERDFRHALELDPGSSDDHNGFADYLIAMGRFNEGLQEIRRARELDPLSLVVNTDYCRLLTYARRYDDSLAQCNATLELDPNYAYALNLTVNLWERKGEYSEAHKIFARQGGCDGSCMAMEDEIHGAPGVAGAFDSWLKAQKEQPDAFFLATAYANLGRKDQAFAWLEKAYEQRAGGNQMIYVGLDPDFDRLRSDPRFDAFLHRAGLPPQPHDLATQAHRLPN